jgi:hypothetical protein
VTGRVKRILLAAVLLLVVVPGGMIGWLFLRYRPRAEREDPAAVQREIASLTQLRDSLRLQVFDAAGTSDLLDRRPAGDIVIALPTPFVATVVQQVVTGWFHDVDLRLPRMRVRKDGEIHARLGIFGRRTVGEYDLDVTLDGVHGRLQPGAPVLTFGGDTIGVVVPVRIAAGTGVARVTASWKSKGLAGPVCGDMSATHDVTGRVRANDYVARGRIRLSSTEGAVLADPDFPELAIRLFIDPSRESVAALDSLLDSRGGLCGFAIGKSRASERIQGLVGRGFRVKIPQRYFRPIRLPVSLETAVPVADQSVGLTVAPSTLSVTSATVWIAASVTADRRATTGTAPPP